MRALLVLAGLVVAEGFEEWRRGSEAALADVHPATEVLRALDRRFAADVVEHVPYLYDHGLADDVEPEERALVDDGTIAATGILYAGRLRSA